MVRPSTLDSFLNLHRQQLMSSGIPPHLWSVLNEKMENQIFDAGKAFRLVKIEYEEERGPNEPLYAVQAISAMSPCDPNAIFLIDHAWTFRAKSARSQLVQVDALRGRMNRILGLSPKADKAEEAEQIFANVWRVCNTYSLANAPQVEDQLPIWYVMDELGTFVTHRDDPNCRIVPFLNVKEEATYSLLFPVDSLRENEIISRDFADGVTGPTERKAALLPWFPCSFEDCSTEPAAPGPDYYLSGHVEETLPDLSKLRPAVPKTKYKVYSDYYLIHMHLTDPKFELVNSEAEADILWYNRHFKHYAQLPPGKFVNQFPFEFVLTVKDLLTLTCRRLTNRRWQPITYNLKTEVGHFVSYFQKRQREHRDNLWIIKPYNLARSLDTHITDNLDYIMRLPLSGPKLAQKYITNPVLFYRLDLKYEVKFDIRYIILLKQTHPLEAYVYKKFFVRFANKKFDLTDFHVYDKHFTVMNYEQDTPLKPLRCYDFRDEWDALYPQHKWEVLEKPICAMLREILEAAVSMQPPCGIAHSPQSRALYAADIMLEWAEDGTMQPRILEINFAPDCQRACEYYPEFYNHIFNLLFADEYDYVFFKL